jgi:hypothetical protein
MTDTKKQMALQTMHRLRSAADEMMLAYHTSGHIAEIHYAYALNDLRRVVEILGDSLGADQKEGDGGKNKLRFGDIGNVGHAIRVAAAKAKGDAE